MSQLWRWSVWAREKFGTPGYVYYNITFGRTSQWIVPRLVTHIYEAFTYLIKLDQTNPTPFLSANKYYSSALLIWGVTGKFGLISNQVIVTIHFFLKFVRNVLVESRINPDFPVTPNIKRSAEELLLREKEWGYFSLTNMLMLPMSDQSWSISRGVAAQFYLAQADQWSSLDRPSNFRHFFIWWRDCKQNNTKPTINTKNLMWTKIL